MIIRRIPMTNMKQVPRKVILQTDGRHLSETDHGQLVLIDMGEFNRTIASFYDNQLAFQVICDSFF
jgi:hypothetical protein